MKKTTLKFLGAIFGTAALASCGGGGLNEATTSSISSFDSTWTATMGSANQWVSDAQAQVAKWETDHAAMDEMMTTWDKKMMEAQTANVAVCHAVGGKGNAVIQTAQDAITAWGAEGSAWADWKKKADDGDVNQEEADSTMTSWNDKLGAANTAMSDWSTQWSAITTEHDAAEAAMKAPM